MGIQGEVNKRRWGGIALGMALAAGGIVPTPLLAHAILVRSQPAQEAAVREPLEKVELWFNEGVGKQYTALAVVDGKGARVDNQDARLGFFDTSYLRVTLPPLAPGTYTVRYRVQSADGHIVSGKFSFSVQSEHTSK